MSNPSDTAKPVVADVTPAGRDAAPPPAPAGSQARPLRERDIETYLVKRVKELGGETRKVQWIARRGAPDRVVFLPGWSNGTNIGYEPPHTIWIELKKPGKKARPEQEREHAMLRKYGQRVEVVDSLERVDEVLGL